MNESRKLLPWFGSNTKLAPIVGHMFGRLRWCGVPFLGGGSELKFLDVKTGVANDLHSQVINLFNVVKNPIQRDELIQCMAHRVYHVEEFLRARGRCRMLVETERDGVGMFADAVEAAADYFVHAWMGRKGQAGTVKEFSNTFAYRWTCSGGNPVTEYNNACYALTYWCSIFQKWAFTCMDALTFIGRVKDHPDHGLYIDAPWPGAGDAYLCKFTEENQRDMASALVKYQDTRIVIRFGDDALIRELYPQPQWRWYPYESRTQGNTKQAEVLLTNFDYDIPMDEYA